MSFQAMTWAIQQKAGGPSAKATLWGIANYANEHGCAWPSQTLMCEESEQSPDTVQRRLVELEERGIIRRIPLRYAGRKTVDFIILACSPYFGASLADLQDLLPRGRIIDPKFAAADCGSDENATATLPQTLPQVADDAAALVRQHEPVREPEEPSERETRACARPVKEFTDAWPTAALDDVDRTARAWGALTDEARAAALASIPIFLDGLKAMRGGRAHVPAGFTYLEQRRWELLPKPAAVAGPTHATFAAWSREWWAALIARCRRGATVAYMLQQATIDRKSVWSEPVADMPAAAEIAAYKAFPSDGEIFGAWRDWFARHGAKLPVWTSRFWVHLPGEYPPLDGEEAGGDAAEVNNNDETETD